MTEDRHDPVRKQQLDHERFELLERLERWLDTPMLVLGLVWLALLVLESTRGLGAALTWLGTAIWIVFILAVVAGQSTSDDRLPRDGAVLRSADEPRAP